MLRTHGYDPEQLINERKLTTGNWEVYRVALAPGKDRLYITSNEGSPFEQHFYQMRFDGERTRITSAIAGLMAYDNPQAALAYADGLGDARRISVHHQGTRARIDLEDQPFAHQHRPMVPRYSWFPLDVLERNLQFIALGVPMTDLEDVKRLAHFDRLKGFEDEVGMIHSIAHYF